MMGRVTYARAVFDRRELLRALGIAGASTIVAACGGASRVKRQKPQIRDEVRTWLRDAVAKLAAVYPGVHVLAVSRRRTTAGIDIIGTGISRARRDGVVLAVRDRDGQWREHVTSELTAAGVTAAVRALVGPQRRAARVTFPNPPPPPVVPPIPDDVALEKRVRAIVAADTSINSRIVYAAALIDIDDATVWSISPRHDREQRLVRVRKRAIRAAWAGSRPVVAEAERGWIGGVDDFELGEKAQNATAAALLLTTPGTFDDREADVVLDPSVTANLIDAGARAILTTSAARRPEVTRRIASTSLAAPIVTLVDDPTVPNAYGGFAFDDEGQPAQAQTLVEEGRVVGVLGDGGKGRGRRPGHVGPIEAASSHLRQAAGTVDWRTLRGDGFLLEGAQHAVFDATTDRVVISAARARVLEKGVDTGRVFADVELVGSLSSLLTGVTGVAKETEVVSYRDEIDGEPRWRSVEAPYMRTRGMVRMRRRA
jgi:predicted Zn-dependent protease